MFTYIFRSLNSSFDEGFELSFRNNRNGGGEWIPLWFFSANEPSDRTIHDISLGNITDDGLLILRGYPVNITSVPENSEENFNIRLCGLRVFNNQTAKGLFNWRFRWLQTVANNYTDDIDIIHIYNVSVTVVNSTDQLLLFQDDFSVGERLR